MKPPMNNLRDEYFKKFNIEVSDEVVDFFLSKCIPIDEVEAWIEGKKYSFKEVNWGDVTSIENEQDETKTRDYCEGHNQALSDLQSFLNTRNK